ncbi:unnamed protein product [Mycena citricolor]|uniref:GST N-terminal domain-containing protein n=1 Tax=Mycena citricolor TaxID=2018698 RepID=A0AAD2JWP0_9AGAR|nr:unnamed protein product [Mycena citricolor]
MSTTEAPTITLHWLEKSRAQRTLWLLEELKVPYQVKTYKRNAQMRGDPALKKVHPLGKSPLLTVGDRAVAESAFISEYLCDHFAAGPESTLVPAKWQPGREGQLGGETDAWMLYRYYMHYAEGSLMSAMLMKLVPFGMAHAPAPFYIRPILSRIAARVEQTLEPECKAHFDFLEAQLASAPEGGPYLCGPNLTAADILMSFPVMMSQEGASAMYGRVTEKTYPKLWAYCELLKGIESRKRAVEKIIEIEGSYDEKLL